MPESHQLKAIMVRTLIPDPLPHRSGRRLLPVLAAFVWAVALHVAVAAGLAGYSGATRQAEPPPRGFEMVEVPGKAVAEETAEAGKSGDSPRQGGGSPPPAEDPPDERSPEPTPEASDQPPGPTAPERPPEPEVIGNGGPIKKRLAEADREPVPDSRSQEPRQPSEPPGEESGPEAAASEQASPEDPPRPAAAEPEAEDAAEDAGDGSDYRPPGVPAGYRDNPAPAYPSRARRRHLEGQVILKVAVDPGGRPTEVTIAESSGHAVLDRAARETVTDWTFRPAKEDGHPVAGTVKVPIRFRLSQR
ncbi:energy transducer TonB [Thiohalorhabdus sp.]|uniref:energy transducer TonB n=1 Tax=Thiohalorhabdus sp. TaxID=3094134 RepID=UPI002FC363A7